MLIILIPFHSDFILENTKVDESFLQDIEVLSVLKGDFEPIDKYLDHVAYKNLDYKLNSLKEAHNLRKILKVQ